jgi:hypothetical protein
MLRKGIKLIKVHFSIHQSKLVNKAKMKFKVISNLKDFKRYFCKENKNKYFEY